MKEFLKILGGLAVLGSVFLLVYLFPLWRWFIDTEIARIDLGDDMEIVFIAMEDDSPSAWAEVVFKVEGEEKDRIPVAFIVQDRSDITDKVTITKRTNNVVEFRYTSEFEIIDYAIDLNRGVFTKNEVKIVMKEKGSNKSLDTTRAKRPELWTQQGQINTTTFSTVI